MKGSPWGFFRISDFVDESLRHIEPRGINFYLYDRSAAPGETFLHFHSPGVRAAGEDDFAFRDFDEERVRDEAEMVYEKTFAVAGREWSVVALPSASFVEASTPWRPWVSSAAVLMMTALLAGYLTSTLGRARRVEGLVAERAAELSERTDALRSEISERVRAEANLREQTGLLSSILNGVGEGVVVLDAGGEFKVWNPAAEQFLGRSMPGSRPESLARELGLYRSDGETYFGEEDMPLYAALRGESLDAVEMYVRNDAHPEGLWLSVSARPLVGPGEDVQGAVAVFRNVAEAVERQAALKANEERLSSVLRGVDDGYWDINLETGEAYRSARWFEILGYEPEEIEVGAANYESLVHPEDLDYHRARYEAHMRGETEFMDSEHRLRGKWGEYRWVRALGQIARDDAGKAVRIVGSTTDITERKMAEAALRDREERLRAIVDTAADGIIIIDEEGTIRDFNRAAERLFGYGAWEVRGQNVKMLMPAPFHGEHDSYLERYLGGGDPRIIGTGREVEGRSRDGTVFPMDLAVSEMRIGGRRMFTGIVRDITERREARVELQFALEKADNRAERLRAVADVAALISSQATAAEIQDACLDGIMRVIVCDRTSYMEVEGETGTIVTRKWRGLQPGNAEGTPLADDVPPAEVLREGSTYALHSGTSALRSRGLGTALSVPVKDGGKVVGIFDIASLDVDAFEVVDIEVLQILAAQAGLALEAARQLARAVEQAEELRVQQEELRLNNTALESAANSIVITDSEGTIERTNSAFTQLTGYARDEVVGQNMRILKSGAHDAEFYADLWSTITGGDMWLGEIINKRRNGSHYSEEMTITPIRNRRGEIDHFIAIKQDITERKELERMKNEFVSTVSHELRTPLTSIRGSLGLLASGQFGEFQASGQRMLDIAVANTDRLVRLINEILDLERIESSRTTMAMVECDVGDLVRGVVDDLAAMADAAGVELRASPVSEKLMADADRIVQTLTNLIGNAIKFSEPGYAVDIKTVVEDGDVLFSVVDRGRGIPAESLGAIFEPFRQVDASDSKQRGGTGLGLAISRRIVEGHGGRIWVESTFGEGSTFSFAIPLGVRAGEYRTDGVDDGGAQRPLVIVCDDDASIREVLREMLENRGYRVVAVGSGEELLETAPRQGPAAILLDIGLPGIDGWEAVAELKGDPVTAGIPVIIITGSEAQVEGSAELEVADQLTKPIEESSVVEALMTAASHRKWMSRVLIVEDDHDLAGVIGAIFDGHGIETHHAATVKAAIELSGSITAELVVPDLGLPDGDGFEVVEWMRRHDRLGTIPLVVYTGSDLSPEDREKLSPGVTDFFIKTRISPDEFEARVVGLLARVVGRAVPEEERIG